MQSNTDLSSKLTIISNYYYLYLLRISGLFLLIIPYDFYLTDLNGSLGANESNKSTEMTGRGPFEVGVASGSYTVGHRSKMNSSRSKKSGAVTKTNQVSSVILASKKASKSSQKSAIRDIQFTILNSSGGHETRFHSQMRGGSQNGKAPMGLGPGRSQSRRTGLQLMPLGNLNYSASVSQLQNENGYRNGYEYYQLNRTAQCFGGGTIQKLKHSQGFSSQPQLLIDRKSIKLPDFKSKSRSSSIHSANSSRNGGNRSTKKQSFSHLYNQPSQAAPISDSDIKKQRKNVVRFSDSQTSFGPTVGGSTGFHGYTAKNKYVQNVLSIPSYLMDRNGLTRAEETPRSSKVRQGSIIKLRSVEREVE